MAALMAGGRWSLNRWRRVACIPQMEMTECGAACLAMILGFHRHHAPLAETRQSCGVDRDGASALAVQTAAAGFGMEAATVKVEVEHLGSLPLPAILHWNFDHFLVLERISRRRAILVDPVQGRHRIALEDLRRQYTGVAIVMVPGEGFRRRGQRRFNLARYRHLFRASLPSLLLVLGASLFLELVGLTFPMIGKFLVDHVVTPGRDTWLWGMAAGFGFALAAQALLTLARSWVVMNLQRALDRILLGGFLRHLLALPVSFFLQRHPGDLMERVEGNIEVRQAFSSQSVGLVLDLGLLAAFLALMLFYHLQLGLIVLGLAGVRLAYQAWLSARLEQGMTAELTASGQEATALVEALSSLETTKATGSEQRMAGRWTSRMLNRCNLALRRESWENTGGQVMVLLQGLTTALVFWLGGRAVLAERMTLGELVAFMALQELFLWPLESLLAAVTQLQYLRSNLRRLDDVLDMAKEPSGDLRPERFEGAIVLEGVGFRYGPEAGKALDRIDLAIAPGARIALVGPSGAGKSTLARLLAGLHVPTEGRIRFDGLDLEQLDLAHLRRRIGVVLQDTFLFDDTIRANLALHDPTLPLEALAEAARRACLTEVIEGLPLGWETRIGPDGRHLSGGQRQRLSLARALVHDPAVLLLDEATSALDPATEARVQAHLTELGCTRITIAHRLATVRDADRILVLDGGRVVQEGPFDALAGTPGLFRDLLRSLEAPGA
jgi:ABC-type bacteriocin/lantibiotic exporter with double-glycine peptidase domain